MIATELRQEAEAAEEGKFRSLLRASTLHALEFQACSVDRSAIHALRRITTALRADSLDIALRLTDHAWRTLPDHVDMLASIYGRLLALEARDHAATLGLLQRVGTPDPDIAALRVRTFSLACRPQDARQCLHEALQDYGVVPDALLTQVASNFLCESEPAPGWISLASPFKLSGELRADDAHDLKVVLDGGVEFIQPTITSRSAGKLGFEFQLPALPAGTMIRASRFGIPLFGSGLRTPFDFQLDGRAEDLGCVVSGWARFGWLPLQPVTLRIQDEWGRCRHTRTGGKAKPGLRWPFQVNLRSLNMSGNRIEISALTPDNRWLPLPDTPLLRERAVRLRAPKVSLSRWQPDADKATVKSRVEPTRRAPAIDVIIPVYRGPAETLACIAAVLSTAASAQVIVVDDASDDGELAAALDSLASAGQITLLRNATNLGFVASVNRALALNPRHDAVLVNSDALVFGDWLIRLRAAAYRSPKVGTVTPFSNSGSIASYPTTDECPMSPSQAETLHRLTASTHDKVSHPIPVGVGFCLYLRRDCLREVGELDASVFGKGYGEETDFCLRARRRGWSHWLAADVFVYHAGGRSFGARRAALLDRSQRLINLRHPGYGRYIADFLAQDSLNPLRRRLDERRLSVFDGKFILLVTLALTGGVARFVEDRCREIRARGLFPLLLRPTQAGDPALCELWTDALDVPSLQYTIPADLRSLTAILRDVRIEAIEIQHFLHLDARVIEAVRTLDPPYDVYVHDYAWICPRVTLIDGSGRYCGEPAVTDCNVCVKRHGSYLKDGIAVGRLRQRSETWLRGARTVMAPSNDAAMRLQRYFPIPIVVRPHTAPPTRVLPRPALGQTVRVAVIGAIGEHKGHRILLDCARDARARGLALEFVVIGYTENDAPLLETGKVFITGRYGEGEILHLIRREAPHIAFLASVWPETWCYALDEALAAGLPVAAFDIGAIAERLNDPGARLLFPLDAPIQTINDRMIALVTESFLPPEHNDAMIDRPRERSLMTKAIDGNLSNGNDALSASVQVLPLPAGLYLFSVKAASSSTERVNGSLRLPAMHVGLGPGVRSDQVEFVAGPATDGAWLFAQDDLLVTKVKTAGATLILTSVRGPGGEVLAIKVERLDGRSDALPAALSAVTERPAIRDAVTTAKVESPNKTPASAVADAVHNSAAVPMQIAAHIRTRGDMSFSKTPWAGRVAPGLWIESFAVKPLEQFAAGDIEYKGLTGSGFETPWLSDDKMCGTKGMSVPLVGFAVRLKPSPLAATYDCEYSGYFKSGMTAGPLRNGAPCRSTVANDPLEGIQIRICKRVKTPLEVTASHPTAKQGPSFGRYRDEQAAKPGNGTLASTVAKKPAAKSKSAVKRTAAVRTASPTRQPARRS